MAFTLPFSRHQLREATRWMHAADSMLTALYRAREGSIFANVLAGASGLGSVLDLVFPEQSPHEQLTALGYTAIDTDLDEFLADQLFRSEMPRHDLRISQERRIVLWDVPVKDEAEKPALRDGVSVLAAVYEGDDFEAGPYVHREAPGALGVALRRIVWGRGKDLMLGVRSRGAKDQRWRESPSYRLDPMQPPPAYHGEPGVEWYVNRLRRHGSAARTMMLVGPTGVGKSLLARRIAYEVVGEARTLKVSSAALAECALQDLLTLIDQLEPAVLLLDDLELEGHYGGDQDDDMLAIFEALHGKAGLVIATRMSEGRSKQNEGDGDDYFAGMRPGRVDEINWLKRPSPRVRRAILLENLGGAEALPELKISEKLLDEIVEACEGLTGAYLVEVAHRLKIHGPKTWKSEVAAIRRAAPTDPKVRHRRRRENLLATATRRAEKKLLKKMADAQGPVVAPVPAADNPDSAPPAVVLEEAAPPQKTRTRRKAS